MDFLESVRRQVKEIQQQLDLLRAQSSAIGKQMEALKTQHHSLSGFLEASAAARKISDEMAPLVEMIEKTRSALPAIPPMPTFPPRAKSEPESHENESTLDGIQRVLRKMSHPVRLSELLVILEKEGVEIRGKKPLSNLGAKLSGNPKRFFRADAGYWTYAGNPLFGKEVTLNDLAD